MYVLFRKYGGLLQVAEGGGLPTYGAGDSDEENDFFVFFFFFIFGVGPCGVGGWQRLSTAASRAWRLALKTSPRHKFALQPSPAALLSFFWN